MLRNTFAEGGAHSHSELHEHSEQANRGPDQDSAEDYGGVSDKDEVPWTDDESEYSKPPSDSADAELEHEVLLGYIRQAGHLADELEEEKSESESDVDDQTH